MNKYLIIIISILLISFSILYSIYNSQKKELNIQKENNSTLMTNIKQSKIRDSLNVSEIGRLQLDHNQMEGYKKSLLILIKDLKLKPAKVQTITNTSIITKDSIVFQLKDSCINHKTQWVDVHGCLGDTLYVSSTDSISQIIYKEYKHKFLWFKWGTKGFKQKIVNYNPNSRIKYAEWIELR